MMHLLTIFLLLFILFATTASPEVLINEIMADPIADESLNEWLELYNNGSSPVNLTGWLIGDDKENDSIIGGLYNDEGIIIKPFGYAVLTDYTTRVYNNFNVSPEATRLYVNDSAIGNGLSNDGERIYLYNNNNYSFVDYPGSDEGLSLSFVNNSWLQTKPTPGYNNQNVPEKNICDYKIEILLSEKVFKTEELVFRIKAEKVKGGSTNITGEIKIIDIFGQLIKEYKPWTSQSISRQRTSSKYTPNLKPGEYTIFTNFSTECIEPDVENNFAFETIVIQGDKPERKSDIDIENILDLGKDNAAKFGQTIRVRLSIYKGDTNKKSIAVWLQDKNGNRPSKQSKANLNEKFTEYELTLPLQIDPNCNDKFENGTYEVMAEGLDETAEESIAVEGITKSLCQEVKPKIQEKSQKASEKASGKKVSLKKENPEVKAQNPVPENVTEGNIKTEGYVLNEPATIYESPSQKSKNLVPIFLVILSVMLNIIFIWKR